MKLPSKIQLMEANNMIGFKFLPLHILYMGYDSGFDSDSDTSIFSRMSGKELGIIIIIAIIGGFFAVQVCLAFQLRI